MHVCLNLIDHHFSPRNTRNLRILQREPKLSADVIEINYSLLQELASTYIPTQNSWRLRYVYGRAVVMLAGVQLRSQQVHTRSWRFLPHSITVFFGDVMTYLGHDQFLFRHWKWLKMTLTLDIGIAYSQMLLVQSWASIVGGGGGCGLCPRYFTIFTL